MCIPMLKPLAKIGTFGLAGLAATGLLNKKKKPTVATGGMSAGQPQTVQASGTFSPYGTGG